MHTNKIKKPYLINALLLSLFAMFVFTAWDSPKTTKKVFCTELNGDGCVCHTVIRSPWVEVKVKGPDTLRAGQSGIYAMYLAKGPALAGGYNIATRFGTLQIMDTISVLLDNEITQRIPLVFPTVHDTIHWYFRYTAPLDKTEDTIYSCGISCNYDGEPSELDQWNYGPKFKVTIVQGGLPVELVSFTGTYINEANVLQWSTKSEMNNQGFTIERSIDKEQWVSAGFVNGKGNTATGHDYQYTIKEVSPNQKIWYRLVQIDFNGTKTVLNAIAIENGPVNNYQMTLSNYPNPFNPSTTIEYGLTERAKVTLTVYNRLGELVALLVDSEKQAGNHSIEWNAGNFATGVYFCELRTGKYSSVKKLLLVK